MSNRPSQWPKTFDRRKKQRSDAMRCDVIAEIQKIEMRKFDWNNENAKDFFIVKSVRPKFLLAWIDIA